MDLEAHIAASARVRLHQHTIAQLQACASLTKEALCKGVEAPYQLVIDVDDTIFPNPLRGGARGIFQGVDCVVASLSRVPILVLTARPIWRPSQAQALVDMLRQRLRLPASAHLFVAGGIVRASAGALLDLFFDHRQWRVYNGMAQVKHRCIQVYDSLFNSRLKPSLVFIGDNAQGDVLTAHMGAHSQLLSRSFIHIVGPQPVPPQASIQCFSHYDEVSEWLVQRS